MARAWCALRPGGLALVGVPLGREDLVAFNAHRVYGPAMLPNLMSNFKLIWSSKEKLGGPTDTAFNHVSLLARALIK